MQICTKCKIEKDVEAFFRQKDKKSGRSSQCKKCESERKARAYAENGEHLRAQTLAYYYANKTKLYKKRKARFDMRIKTDAMFRLQKRLRTRLWHALKQKTGSAVRDVGCSIEELKAHLEIKFQPGMSWKNYGKWHIDHIKPLSSFDLTNKTEFLKAVHFSNLQPLWAKQNLQKYTGALCQ